MRVHPLTIAAGAGLAVTILATSLGNAFTISAPAGMRQAAAPLDLSQAVHCRRYAHRHGNRRGLSRGCSIEARGARPARAGIMGPRGSGGIYNPAPQRLAPLSP